MQSKQIQINDCYLHYVEAGPQLECKGSMIFLHGFPEHWRTWRRQLDHFSPQYRCIAPDLPGYNQSSAASDLAFYQIPNLINLMAHFIESVSDGQPVILIAHDWGGAIAWPLCAFYPQLVARLVILNAAHPSTFTREMIHNPQQRAKSDYIYELIAADAEARVSANDYAFLSKMFEAADGQLAISEAQLDEYKQSWSLPNALTAMLNYYRAMPQLASKATNGDSQGPMKALAEMTIPNIRVDVPTLVLWGEQDLAFVSSLLDDLQSYVPELTVIKFPNANHWLHHQFPDAVNAQIQAFISTSNSNA